MVKATVTFGKRTGKGIYKASRRMRRKVLRKLGAKKRTERKLATVGTVKRMISRVSENKEAYRQNADYPVKATLATADYGSIIPTVSQGVTVQGRIGDELKCKGIYVKGLVQIDFSALTGSVFPAIVTAPTLYVRVMCLESKTYAAAGIQSTSIFKKNGATFAPTTNSAMNLYDAIDRDTIRVHFDRVIALQNPLAAGGTATYINPNFRCFAPFSFKLLKNTKLIFDTNANDTCLNRQPQLLAFACDPQGLWSGTGSPVNITYRSMMYFEDN